METKTKMKKRTREQIVDELIQTAKKYKGLQPGSVAFRNVSRKLQSLDLELTNLDKK